MNELEINISDEAPEDVVQFVKHLEENLDPADEFDCNVIIETAEREEMAELIDDVSILSEDDLDGEPTFGVRVFVEFVDNADAPDRRIHELADSFYGQGEYELHGAFNGGKGEYTEYIFDS